MSYWRSYNSSREFRGMGDRPDPYDSTILFSTVPILGRSPYVRLPNSGLLPRTAKT